MWGTYQGTATVASVGQSRATLEGEITGGTGDFAGAVGSFRGSGKGGFVNDGEFSVMLHARISTAGRESVELPVMLKGTSTSTCTTIAPPRLSLDGWGDGKANDRAVAHLEHDLGTQICAIIVE